MTSIHINDFDPAVYAFWMAAVHHPEELARKTRDTKPTLAQWYRQRARYRRGRETPNDMDPVDFGFAAFFLNRTNRSGIITGGPIGGKLQESEWLIDARYNGPDLANRILQIGENAGRITVSNLDAEVLLARLVPKLPRKALIYMDPPYYEKGASKLYASYYERENHATIASTVRALPCPWIVSYDDAPEIHRLYRGFRRIRYNLSYSANERRRGGETMFFSDDLVVPYVESPELLDRSLMHLLESRSTRVLSERTRRVPRLEKRVA